MTVYDKLIELFSTRQAEFKIVEHQHEGRSEEIAKIRGNSLQQSAKAMLFAGKEKNGQPSFILAVLPGHRRVSLSKVKHWATLKSIKLASNEQVYALTDCVIGAVPPFSFNESLKLVIDPELVEANDSIVFNAGRLDRSVFLNTRDYLALVHEQAGEIHAVAEVV